MSTDTGVGIYWYENDGRGNFTRHAIDRRSGEWLERHAIADINGDGKPEIVCVDNINGSLLWFDFDGDGELEVAASSWVKGNQFAYFDHQDGRWVKSIIDAGVKETRMVCAADVNGDGRLDIIGTATASNLLVWYENPGDPSTRPWPKHVIDTPERPIHGQPADMDSDGDVDIVVAIRGADAGETALETPGSQIAWYENVGGDVWKKHVIADPFHHASEAIASDVDGDGQVEVIASGWGPEGRLALFKHRGDPRGPRDMHIVDQGRPGHRRRPGR